MEHSKFARSLAHTEVKIREKGFAALTKWLTSREEISDGDMLKIWKGLFFSMWHADLAPVQADLADRMAKTIMALEPGAAACYLRTFFQTMQREWFGIDKLRLDKYMLLCRRFVCHFLGYLQRSEWDEELVVEFVEAVTESVFFPGAKPSMGLCLHLADIYTDCVYAVEGEPPSQATIVRLLEPFVQVVARHRDPAVVKRAQACVFEEGVMQRAEEEATTSGEEAASKGSKRRAGREPASVLALLLTRVQELAEAEEGVATPKNRKWLYALKSQLAEQQKSLAGRKRKAAPAPAEEEEEDPTPDPPASRKKKKARADSEAPAEEGEEASTSDPKAKKGKQGKKRDEDAALPAKKQKQGGAAGTAPGGSGEEASTSAAKGKKAKKARRQAVDEDAEMEGFEVNELPPSDFVGAAGDWGEAAMTADDLAAPSGGKKAKKGRKAEGPSTGTPAAAGSTPATPVTAPARTPASAASPATSARKSVRFSLKSNLEFKVNAPLPDPDVRTPLLARPHGSALKAVSKFGGTPGSTPGSTPKMKLEKRLKGTPGTGSDATASPAFTAGTSTPKSTPGSTPRSKKKKQPRPATPAAVKSNGGSAQRPKAADFFA